MRLKGRVVEWNDARGFGFVLPEDGDEKLFVHIRAFPDRRRPRVDDEISYELGQDPRGRPCAQGVRYQEALPQRAQHHLSRFESIIAVGCFLGVLLLGVNHDIVPFGLVLMYVLLSLFAFGLYAWDKYAALHDRWRTKERTLLLVGFLGGWPGALIAQDRLRHLTRKAHFRRYFWLSVVGNIVFLCWLLTPDGRIIMRALGTLAGGSFGG
ncbi:MAG: cold shock and DUF1294 domain-containing protein [Pseudomonadales bacterium]|jgi:uncharacterized membrane protein YsdA (DUF1294 family)/cold shock CspA family protein|nr:cold shock and DUF1294 domain-containing protein [Pseudomonadales bacterium]